jgi:hypothetical protein
VAGSLSPGGAVRTRLLTVSYYMIKMSLTSAPGRGGLGRFLWLHGQPRRLHSFEYVEAWATWVEGEDRRCDLEITPVTSVHVAYRGEEGSRPTRRL